MFNILDITFNIEKVNINIKILDIMLIVWFGTNDTKYENITSIPPI